MTKATKRTIQVIRWPNPKSSKDSWWVVSQSIHGYYPIKEFGSGLKNKARAEKHAAELIKNNAEDQ